MIRRCWGFHAALALVFVAQVVPVTGGVGAAGDQAMHVAGCAAVTVLRLWTVIGPRWRAPSEARLALILILGGEALQALLPWRQAAASDVIANAVGVALGAIVWAARPRRA